MCAKQHYSIACLAPLQWSEIDLIYFVSVLQAHFFAPCNKYFLTMGHKNIFRWACNFYMVEMQGPEKPIFIIIDTICRVSQFLVSTLDWLPNFPHKAWVDPDGVSFTCLYWHHLLEKHSHKRLQLPPTKHVLILQQEEFGLRDRWLYLT